MNDKIKVTGHINASINFAMQQNYVPIIRNIHIVSESEDVLKDL